MGNSSHRLPDDFHIDEQEYVGGETVVLTVHGETDIHVAGELEARLTEIIDAKPSALVLDLSGVTFIDSMALGVLLHGLRRLGESGGTLRVVTARPDIRRIFELTLLDRLFELDSSREEALAAAATGGSS